jgi:hypothetical protein
MNNKGSTLIGVVVFSTMIIFLCMGFVKFISIGSDRNKRTSDSIKAFWANEAGLNIGFRYLSLAQTGSSIDYTILSLGNINGLTPSINIVGTEISDPLYSENVTSSCLLPNSGISNISEIITNFKSMQYWTLFENDTGTAASLWVSKIINGDYHTNGNIRVASFMSGGAHVTGLLTSSRRFLKPPASLTQVDRINYPVVYQNGIARYNSSGALSQTETPPVNWLEERFPNYEFVNKIDVQNVTPASFTGTVYNYSTADGFDSVMIVLKNKVFDLRRKSILGKTWQTWVAGVSILANPIIKTNQIVLVYGTLEGRLTIVTTRKDIVIIGKILYKELDLTKPNAKDALALVSGGDISILDSSLVSNYDFKDNSADNRVYGYLFAQDTLRVMFQGHYRNAGGSYTRNISLYGGTSMRAPASTYGTSAGDGGLIPIYNADPRLVNGTISAPGIPVAKVLDKEMSIRAGADRFMNSFRASSWSNKMM